eukprot:GHVT01053003.1.p2 GENE.GHVT01053003.1~~GHVT01053003.1.p2  ORF type:complete len:227 (+),score=8.39 GHVT01053003.1:1372-2052(+)
MQPQCRAFAKLEIILKEKFGPFGTFKRRKGGGMKVADRRWTNRHMKVSPSMTLTSRQVKRLNPPMFFGVCENKGNWKIHAQNVPEPVKDLLKLSSKICHNDVLYSYPDKALRDVHYCSNYPILDPILIEQLGVKVETPSNMENLEKYDLVLNKFLHTMLEMENHNSEMPKGYKFEVTQGAKSCIKVTHTSSNKSVFLSLAVFNEIFSALISKGQNIPDYLVRKQIN